MNEQTVIERLERDVTELRIANASLSESVKHLSISVQALTATVGVLRDTMNQGKGALGLMVAAAGIASSLVTFGMTKLFSNG